MSYIDPMMLVAHFFQIHVHVERRNAFPPTSYSHDTDVSQFHLHGLTLKRALLVRKPKSTNLRAVLAEMSANRAPKTQLSHDACEVGANDLQDGVPLPDIAVKLFCVLESYILTPELKFTPENQTNRRHINGDLVKHGTYHRF